MQEDNQAARARLWDLVKSPRNIGEHRDVPLGRRS